MKRLILIIILVIVAILGVSYFIFTGKIENPLTQTENQQVVGELPGDNVGGSGGFTNDGRVGFPDSSGASQDPSAQPRLMKVVPGPIAGYSAYQQTYIEVIDDEQIERKRLVVTYVDRTNGNMIERDVFAGNEKKLSNTTLTRIQSAEVGSSGLLVGRIVGDGDVVRTLIGRAASSTGFTYAFIDNNLTEVHISPNQSSLLIGRVSGGKFQAVVTNTSGTNGKVIFESPLSEWKMAWRDNSSVIITTKTSYGVNGISYLVTTGGAKSLITMNVPGLQVAAAPAGSSYLISSFYSGGPATYIQTNTAKVPTTATLMAEKCAWKTSGKEIVCGAGNEGRMINMPDIWYKGLLRLNEEILVTDGVTGTSRVAHTPQTIDENGVDVIRPQLVDDRYFFFMNKIDGSLWMADVSV